MRPIYTANITAPVATRDLVAREMRRAVAEGRSPRPIYPAVSAGAHIGAPVADRPLHETIINAIGDRPLAQEPGQPGADVVTTVVDDTGQAQMPQPTHTLVLPAVGIAAFLVGAGIMWAVRR